jgi:hypothetical protein
MINIIIFIFLIIFKIFNMTFLHSIFIEVFYAYFMVSIIWFFGYILYLFNNESCDNV